MTNEQNEQKAKEIAHDYFRRGQLGLVAIDTESAGYDCAIQAMQWKDEQFAIEKEKLIDKACEFWEHKFPYIGVDTIKEFVDTMKGGEYGLC